MTLFRRFVDANGGEAAFEGLTTSQVRFAGCSCPLFSMTSAFYVCHQVKKNFVLEATMLTGTSMCARSARGYCSVLILLQV